MSTEYYKTRPVQVETTVKQPTGLRRSNRFQVTNASIKLRKSGMLQYLLNSNNHASLVNLSISGIQLMITQALKAEDNYQINLYTPAFINPVIMKAKVVWCRPYKKFFDKTYYRAGFQFVKISQEVTCELKRLEDIATKRVSRPKLQAV
ncbi:MAG: PilZ domain-containing protein [Thermodesulfobacteriota bacterium]